MAEILIYDLIGDGGITALDIVQQLKALEDQEPLTVRINSPGGSVFDGLAIFNALKEYAGPVSVFIDGIALSMASGIAMAGDHVVMAENALLMLHDPQAAAMGDEREMLRTAEMLTKTRDALLTAYTTKSGRRPFEVEAMMRDETWLSAREALSLGFIDEVGEEMRVAAQFDLPRTLKVPAPIAGVFEALTQSQPTESQTMPTAEKETNKAATIDQLKGLKGATNDFVVEQLSRGATLAEALDALNAQLEETREQATNRAQEQAEEVTRLRNELDSLKDSQQKLAGNDPVGDGARLDDAEVIEDPVARFNELFEGAKAQGRNAKQAYDLMRTKHRDILLACREAANQHKV